MNRKAKADRSLTADDIMLAVLDRNAIGSIFEEKLVFLNRVLSEWTARLFRPHNSNRVGPCRGSAVWKFSVMGIDNESDQVS
jgi:hypothetical protein